MSLSKINARSSWFAALCASAFLFAFLLLLYGPFAADAKQSKVELCHRTGNGSFHIINVAQPSVSTHLAHGDAEVGEACTVGIGACEATGKTICASNGAKCDAVTGDPSPEVCDGIDNDCDGAVDEDGVCTPACTTPADCDDANACTNDTCVGGACQYAPKSAGTPCDDGLFCTVSDACNGAGQCSAGIPRDCSHLNTVCTVGICDEGTTQCLAQPLADGTLTGNTCTMTNVFGTCQASAVCAEGSESCTPETPSQEVCDGLDNDCDGVVDEGC